MPKVVKDAGLDVHVLGERVLVRYDVLLALRLLLALLPHPQVILVRTSITRVSLRSTSKVISESKPQSTNIRIEYHSVCPLVGIGTPSPCPASESVLPRNQRGDTLACG